MENLRDKIQKQLAIEKMRSLAKRAGVSTSMISRYMSDPDRDLMSESARKIEAALDHGAAA